MTLTAEEKRLKQLSPQFSSQEGFNGFLVTRRYQYLTQFFRGTSCLELGSADGQGTKILAKHFDHITAVDGSQEYIDLINTIQPEKITGVCSLIETLDLSDTFDTLICAHVLEHVSDPVEIMSYARKFMDKNSVFIVDVPNANSLHRLAGVRLGHLKSTTELHEGDLRIGHRRVYTPETLRMDIERAGLKTERIGGMFIKPLSNAQISEQWDPKLIEAYFELGDEYPDIASEIYAVCTL